MPRQQLDIRIPKAKARRLKDDYDLGWAIFEPIAERVVRLSDPNDKQYRALARLTPGQAALFTTSNLDGEVMNGGFAQYFSNSSGMFAHQALAGLRLLGAKQHADFLTRAMQIFPKGIVPQNRGRRQLVLHGGDKRRLREFQSGGDVYLGVPVILSRFKPLERKYYKRIKNIAAYWRAYIDKHPEEFFK